MTTIKQLFGVRSVVGDIALEIELEGKGLPGGDRMASEYWKVDRDGSLRAGGLEYVFTYPRDEEGVKQALKELLETFDANKSIVMPSYRAGIHCHINVQSLTPTQLINYIISYIILEELLVGWCGPTRQGNHFCFRAMDAEYLIERLEEIVSTGQFGKYISDEIRYSGVNLCALPKYGSLEFRALESTLDVNRITTWARVLKRLRDKSMAYADPVQLIRSLSVNGVDKFAKDMLEEDAPTFLVGDWKTKIREGVILTQGIAFARVWGGINLNIFKPSKNVFV